VCCTDLGRLDYAATWRLQRALVGARKAGLDRDRLLLVEHPAVVTLGRRAREDHVLAGAETLAARGVAVHRVERGGDVTVHGPGQLVAYPILDLRLYRCDVRWYAESLLEVVVRTAARMGVTAQARRGRETGVWVADGRGGEAKLAQLGVRVERWVTYHGVALNVDECLACFDWIVPCGLHGVSVTSLARELGRPVTLDEVRPAFVAAFGAVFGVRVEALGASELRALAARHPLGEGAP